jgi:hypothetical protein
MQVCFLRLSANTRKLRYKEDNMKVNELIQMMNEQGLDIYELSIEEGFSKGTLRPRLLGILVSTNAVWEISAFEEMLMDTP